MNPPTLTFPVPLLLTFAAPNAYEYLINKLSLPAKPPTYAFADDELTFISGIFELVLVIYPLLTPTKPPTYTVELFELVTLIIKLSLAQFSISPFKLLKFLGYL